MKLRGVFRERDTFNIFFLLQNDKIYYTLSASKMSLQVIIIIIIIQKVTVPQKTAFNPPAPKFYSKQYLFARIIYKVLSTFIHC